jgi:alkaline phosphatase D
VDRRTFLTDLSRYAFFCAGVPNAWRVTARPRLADDPFTLGVASGDPTPDSCVIWTRLATDPLAPLGGLNGLRTVIGWEVAHDEAFSRIVRQGRYTCAPELSFSAHVDVQGLEPDRWYFYRFTSSGGSSPVGRLRTTPTQGSVRPLDLAFVSCNHWEQGLFTAYRHLADEEVDLVAHLGDYIYEYAGNTARVRTHAGPEVITLDDYRSRYAQYKSDPQLQAAHAGRPWLVTWDDHEVDNNYAQRRAAGYQAWWEHQPVRVPRPDSWADLTIQRSATWGSLARLWVLDTRQYRSDQPCGDGAKPVPCGDWGDPDHTMLGPAQERWLLDGLGGSSARWQVLAQQVMMAPFDRAPDDSVLTSMDQWSGYPAARDRLLRAVAERAPGRTVVLTGDIHSNWVNDLRRIRSARQPGRRHRAGGDLHQLGG